MDPTKSASAASSLGAGGGLAIVIYAAHLAFNINIPPEIAAIVAGALGAAAIHLYRRVEPLNTALLNAAIARLDAASSPTDHATDRFAAESVDLLKHLGDTR